MAIDLALRLPPGLLGDDLYFTTTAITISPVLGGELLSNGDFSGWSADNPTGWGIVETAPDPEASQAGSGNLHGGGGSGACNFYSSATQNRPSLTQTVLTVQAFYRIALELSAVGAGAVESGDSAGLMTREYSTVGSHAHTGRATTTDYRLRGRNPAINLTLDSTSVQPLSALEQWFTHPADYGDFSAALTISAGYQGGIVFNGTDENNFARLVLDRLDNKIYLLKRSGGAVTQIGAWSITYSAGQTLTARRHKDGTLDVIYNGAAVASGLASTGLNGRRAGPFLTDAANVTVHRYSWDARRAS